MEPGRIHNVSTRTWVAMGVGVAVVGAALLWLAFSNNDADVTPRESVSAEDGCGGVDVQRIELNSQVLGPTDTFCFVIEQVSDVTIGAAALDVTQPLVLEVTDADAALQGAAASSDGIDPQLVLRLEPGTYFGHVSTPGEQLAAAFLVYTAAFPAATGGTTDAPNPGVDLPSVDQCGGSIPMVAHGDRMAGTATSTLACLEITDQRFVKVGAQTADSDANPDLQIAVYRADGEGFTLIRANDDAFGLDPELSFDAVPGLYLIATYAWFGEPTGDFTLYVDTEGTTWRDDYPSPRFTHVTDATCATGSATVLGPGDDATMPAGLDVVCLDIAAAGRYTLTVTSQSGDSLAMEVMRPSPGGAPVRFAYTDHDPYATAPTPGRILIDATFPQGTFAVGVFSWFTDSAPGAYTVTLEPSVPR
ncbi:MAG: hypothetical protein CVT64_11620 [Actinobacteria bacterium HGW-Actinobacteria-4]|nr:MAG: hypothetical protein CVT64_11620 [Actinobacteria bacterium HGW-Actinobacteria-4]